MQADLDRQAVLLPFKMLPHTIDSPLSLFVIALELLILIYTIVQVRCLIN